MAVPQWRFQKADFHGSFHNPFCFGNKRVERWFGRKRENRQKGSLYCQPMALGAYSRRSWRPLVLYSAISSNMCCNFGIAFLMDTKNLFFWGETHTQCLDNVWILGSDQVFRNCWFCRCSFSHILAAGTIFNKGEAFSHFHEGSAS